MCVSIRKCRWLHNLCIVHHLLVLLGHRPHTMPIRMSDWTPTFDPLRIVKHKLFPQKDVKFPSKDPKLFAEIMSLLLQHEVSYMYFAM